MDEDSRIVTRMRPRRLLASKRFTAFFIAVGIGAISWPVCAERRPILPTPTLIWAAAQVIPSPGLQVIRREAYFTMRWQVTPLLYSFGVRREVNPWRVLLAEPNVRHSGSIEVFLSPEYTSYLGDIQNKWAIRSGVRSYFPVVENGEGLSISLGGSHSYFNGQHSVGFEVGTYVLFGILGLQVTYTPKLLGAESWMASFRVRYF